MGAFVKSGSSHKKQHVLWEALFFLSETKAPSICEAVCWSFATRQEAAGRAQDGALEAHRGASGEDARAKVRIPHAHTHTHCPLCTAYVRSLTL